MSDLKDVKPVVDPISGGIGVTVGLALAALLNGSGMVDLNQTDVNAALDSLSAQGKIAVLPEVTDKLALSSDSIKPAYKKIYPERVNRDSTGKVLSTVKADTVDVAAAPVLAGFPDGVSDYPMAAIVKAGSTLRIVYILDGKEINSHLIQPKTADWLISEKPTASIHTGK
jgi:hypothetical protein